MDDQGWGGLDQILGSDSRLALGTGRISQERQSPAADLA
jgi:hypothetical protein